MARFDGALKSIVAASSHDWHDDLSICDASVRCMAALARHDAPRLWLVLNAKGLLDAAVSLLAHHSIHVAASARALVAALVIPGWPTGGLGARLESLWGARGAVEVKMTALALLEDVCDAAAAADPEERGQLFVTCCDIGLFKLVRHALASTDRAVLSRATAIIGVLVALSAAHDIGWRQIIASTGSAAATPGLFFLEALEALLLSKDRAQANAGFALAQELITVAPVPSPAAPAAPAAGAGSSGGGGGTFPAGWNTAMTQICFGPLFAQEKAAVALDPGHPLRPAVGVLLQKMALVRYGHSAQVRALSVFQKCAGEPGLLGDAALRQVHVAVTRILGHEADAHFQRSRQAVVALRALCAHPGITHTEAAPGFGALRGIIETPPMFAGQACAHTLLGAALETIGVMWTAARVEVPSCEGDGHGRDPPASGGSKLPATDWARRNDVAGVMLRLLEHRVLDPRWEVREAVVAFVAALLRRATAPHTHGEPGPCGGLIQFVRSAPVLQLLWNARNDEASFVQASPHPGVYANRQRAHMRLRCRSWGFGWERSFYPHGVKGWLTWHDRWYFFVMSAGVCDAPCAAACPQASAWDAVKEAIRSGSAFEAAGSELVGQCCANGLPDLLKELVAATKDSEVNISGRQMPNSRCKCFPACPGFTLRRKEGRSTASSFCRVYSAA